MVLNYYCDNGHEGVQWSGSYGDPVRILAEDTRCKDIRRIQREYEKFKTGKYEGVMIVKKVNDP